VRDRVGLKVGSPGLRRRVTSSTSAGTTTDGRTVPRRVPRLLTGTSSPKNASGRPRSLALTERPIGPGTLVVRLRLPVLLAVLVVVFFRASRRCRNLRSRACVDPTAKHDNITVSNVLRFVDPKAPHDTTSMRGRRLSCTIVASRSATANEEFD